MGAHEEFETVRTALRAEERALTAEIDEIEVEARGVVDASAQHVRDTLATQAERIHALIAQEREELAALQERQREELARTGTVEDPDAPLVVVPDELDDTVLPLADEPADASPPHDALDDVAPALDVDQPDGTGVEHLTTADDDAGPTVGEVERGD